MAMVEQAVGFARPPVVQNLVRNIMRILFRGTKSAIAAGFALPDNLYQSICEAKFDCGMSIQHKNRLDHVSDILTHHGIKGPWEPLCATGVSNRIYATKEVVLRIATDHADALADARTESIAAPAARAAGVLTPRLLVFDDSLTLLDRPYSIWERISGETLGLLPSYLRSRRETWADVGRQLARLHTRVNECPDPLGWLDQPGRELGLADRLAELGSASRIDRAIATEIARWIEALQPAVATTTQQRFLHNDIHDMNLMCSQEGSLLAVIDWGDAGWGDPALEFAQIPLAVMPFVIAAYEVEAPGFLGDAAEARIIWDHLDYALAALPDDPRLLLELRRFLRTSGDRWRRASRAAAANPDDVTREK
ncbi:MAG TPA: aminoglycoside phosphotransferase family protein [Candidatus Dormibacteraeota bacterium]|nr:aminoglycoside phosphotransferase family protein [Candidatus Dormibacteraeota bacterium]